MYTMVVKEVIAIERGGEAEQFQDYGNKLVYKNSPIAAYLLFVSFV